MRYACVRISSVFVFLLLYSSVTAQYEFGVKLGFTPANTKLSNNHVIVNGEPSAFLFNTERAGSEFFAGVFARYLLDDGFFVQSDVLYRNQSMDYLINYLDSEADNQVVQEHMHEIAVPVSLGVVLGEYFEVSSGFTPRILLSHSTGLNQFQEFRSNLSPVALSLHTAVGFSFEHVMINLTYMLDFRNYGAHLYMNDKQLQLSNAAGRLIVSVGYSF